MKQKEDCYRLWEECFHDTKKYMDYYFKEKTKDNRILTEYEGSRLASMVHLNPYRLKFRELQINAYYIVGVATAPSFRKQGRMKRLLEGSFQLMKEEHQVFTYLMPADERIYRPFGFEYIYSQRRLSLGKVSSANLRDASALVSKGCEIYQLEDLKEEELERVVGSVNELLEQNFTIYAIRDFYYYKRLVKEMQAAGGRVLVFVQNAAVVGVIAYMQENGITEVAESVIMAEKTAEVISGFLSRVVPEKESEVIFLESHFIDLPVIKKMFPELKVETKPIIMAKLLEHSELQVKEFFKEDKIYLNEIV